MPRRVGWEIREARCCFDFGIHLRGAWDHIEVLGIPALNASIHHRSVQQCQRACGAKLALAMLADQIIGNDIPVTWRCRGSPAIGPEVGDTPLLAGAVLADVAHFL